MTGDERYLGETTFYDVMRDTTFRNGVDVSISDEQASLGVMNDDGTPAVTRSTGDRAVVRMMRGLFQDLRRHQRRHAPVQPNWKHRTEPLVEACPECDDRRFLEDPATGEEWPCPACNAG